MIKFLYLVFTPLFIMCILLKRLFFKKQSVYLLNLSYYYLIMYFIAALVCFVVLINFFKMKLFPNNSKSYLEQIVNRHNILYINTLNIIDYKIKFYIRKIYNIKKLYGMYILPFFRKDFIGKHIYVLFYIIPKTIILLCFIIDIFIFKKFHYFFMSLILFLVPLFCDYLFFSLGKELDYEIESIDPLIEIRKISDKSSIIYDNEGIVLELPKTIPLKEYIKNIVEFKDDKASYEINLSYYFFEKSTDVENINVKKILNSYVRYFQLLFDMYELFILYELQKKKYQTICIVFYTLIFLLGWITILYYNIIYF